MCNDKAINYLSSIGFNIIGLPMEGIEPLFLFRTLDSGYLESLGLVTGLIEPRTPGSTPKVKTDCKISNAHLENLVTDSFGFDIGTERANNILKQLGIKSDILQELGFSYQRVRKVKFSFDNILCDATTVKQLAKYFRIGNACYVNDLLKDLIIDCTTDRQKENRETIYNPASRRNHQRPLYSVIIKTLKSNSFSISAYDDEEMKVNLGLQLSNGMSLGLGCEVSSKDENLLTFKGNKYLVFGVQTAPLFVEKRGTKDNNMLITKFDPPDNINEFTGELFTPSELLGGDPFLKEKATVVKLNHGNPIRLK
jgi:hypothetical protein